MKKAKINGNSFFNKIKRSRIPLVILLIVLLIGLCVDVQGFNKLNKPVNREIVARHAQNVRRIHHDNNKIFAYRAQLTEVSDNHMMYLLHHPKLKSHAKYMDLTDRMMRINNYDDGEINKYQVNANDNRHLIKYEHPRSATKNALSPIGTKASDQLVKSFSVAGLLTIVILIIITKIAKFKDDLMDQDFGVKK